MAFYKLPESLVVRPRDNKVPPFGLKLTFAEGALAEHRYMPSNVNALWSLAGAAYALSPTVFFEVEREDSSLVFQGFGNTGGFCLFHDTGNHEILIFGQPEIDGDNLDLLQIWDPRWGLTYFLPKSVLGGFEAMVAIGNQALQSGTLPQHIAFSQKFPDLGLPDGYC